MKELIESWERRSVKYKKLADKTHSVIKEEGLLASAEVYDVCVDELRRVIASNKPLKRENHTSVECGICGKDHFDFECPDRGK